VGGEEERERRKEGGEEGEGRVRPQTKILPTPLIQTVTGYNS